LIELAEVIKVIDIVAIPCFGGTLASELVSG
jgi:hypothetical protein